MTQIACMLQLSVISDLSTGKIFQSRLQNLAEIRMYDSTLWCSHNIIKASSAVHSKSQRPILILIPKGKFHLVAVAFVYGTSLNSLKFVGITDLINQPLYLLSLNL